MDLLLVSELSPQRFAELGKPFDVLRDDVRGYALVLTTFDAANTRLESVARLPRFRASLYTADLQTRIATIPFLEHPVNGIAVHPTRPMVALATGSYDGGYSFDGQLLLWEWEHDEIIEVLSCSREVWGVRFDSEDALALLLRPPNDDQYANPFRTLFAGTLTDLRPYQELGLSRHDPDPRIADFALLPPDAVPADVDRWQAAARWERAFASLDFEYRCHVRDVAWADDEHVLAVHDGCQVEAWDLQGHRGLDLRGPSVGARLLCAQTGVYVHLARYEHGAHVQASRYHMTIARLDGNALSELYRHDASAEVSIDAVGRLLVRDHFDQIEPDHVRRDCVLGSDGRELLVRDLGGHKNDGDHLRVDGGDALYLLRDVPAVPVPRKYLFRIDADLQLRECWPWDTGALPYICNLTTPLPNGRLARACTQDTWELLPAHLEVRDLASGALIYSYALWAAPTCLAHDEDWLFYALIDGTIGVVDLRTGERVCERKFHIDGVPVIASSLAARGELLACGTVDGRVLLLRIAAERVTKARRTIVQ